MAAYSPHREVTVDEAMIAFRGRLSFRQYLPAKPTKYGIKVWVREDSTNGFAQGDSRGKVIVGSECLGSRNLLSGML